MSALDDLLEEAAPALDSDEAERMVKAAREELAALRAEIRNNYHRACMYLAWASGPEYPRGGLARAIHDLAQKAEEARSREETARAEVERLREENEEVRDEAYDLAAEVERLRGALQEVHAAWNGKTTHESAHAAIQRVRALLRKQEGKP